MLGAGRQVVRTSGGTLYAVINDGGSCEVWSSSDGSTWAEQDSADNPACTSAAGSYEAVAAIDSTDKLHIAYVDDVGTTQINYITFTTSDNQFGTEETDIGSLSGGGTEEVAIAVDSNDKPHVTRERTFGTGSNVMYTNKVGESWRAAVTLESTGIGNSWAGLSIEISEDNIPEISYINSIAADLTVAVGNLNDATSFTLQDVDIVVNTTAGQSGSSIAVDSSGNTWVGYVDATGTNQVTLVEHLDADAWSTWQTPVTNSNVGNEPSIAINGSDIYVFYEDSADDDIKYDRYNGSWLGETSLETGTFQDTKAKWAYYNNTGGSTRIDYLYSDATDIYCNSLNL